MRYALIFICLFGVMHAESPWGKDCDLAFGPSKPKAKTRCNTAVMGPIAEAMIRVHQTYISPSDGPRSNFKPSSSQYMLNSIRKYGFFKGFTMGCDRLMRENPDPWIYRKIPDDWGSCLKVDPVP